MWDLGAGFRLDTIAFVRVLKLTIRALLMFRP
jgi:hypothetical protein